MSSEPVENTAPDSPAPVGDGPATSERTPAGATTDAKPKLAIKPPPRKKWGPPPPASPLSKLAWKLVFGATILAMLLLGVIIILMVQSNTPKADGPPTLGEEFRDPVNTYAIRPPANWTLQDPHDGRNFYIKGPKERGYIPLMTICLDVAAGRLESYIKEYKGRLQAEDPSIKFVSESTVKIDKDKYQAVRLVYTWSSPNSDNTVTTVKTVQYVVDDAPRFYRVSGSVREDAFDKYLPRFDASANSFSILPLNTPTVNTVAP